MDIKQVGLGVSELRRWDLPTLQDWRANVRGRNQEGFLEEGGYPTCNPYEVDPDMPPRPLHAGGWLHGARGGRGGPEAGAHQGRETRAQLHDGHSTHQAGKDASPVTATSPPGPQGQTLLTFCTRAHGSFRAACVCPACAGLCHHVNTLTLCTGVHFCAQSQPSHGPLGRRQGFVVRQPDATYKPDALSRSASLCLCFLTYKMREIPACVDSLS